MRMRRTLIDARRNSLAAVDALDRMQIGVFAATRSGQVFFRNAEANRQIDSCPQVSVVQDRLTVTGLSRHLFETNDTDAVVLNDQLLSLHCGEVLVLPSAEQSLPLLVQIELSAGICEDDTWMIFVCDLDRLRGTGKDVLASIAGLTQAETEVLNALSRGADLAHIARLRDTSKVTVRNQLSSVLNKLRCKSQKDAVALNAVTSLAQLRDPKA
jgi:DNA-binding CsgD family transcriptional regulator